MKLSTRPEKRVGSDAAWDHAEGIMQDVLKQIEARSGNQKIKTAINPGEGAFYGPKFEYVLRDAIGRDWQCGTTQVDFNLPERFDAFYIAADGQQEDAGDDPSRDLRLDGALPRRPARALCRPPAAVARADAGGGRHHHLGCRRLCARGRREGDARWACGSSATFATRRSTTRCASTRSPRCRCCWWSARRRPPSGTVSIRRLGSDGQTVMPLDAALAALVDEAVPPDVRRMRQAA